MQVDIPAEFGYVIFVFIGSVVKLFWLSYCVGVARKKFGVKYPTMYDPSKPQFDCYQRAHQNTLESYPFFVALLLLGGLQHPIVSSIAGIVWIVGRVFYALGYQTGMPEKRMQGSFSYFGLFGLVGTTFSFAIHLLGWI